MPCSVVDNLENISEQNKDPCSQKAGGKSHKGKNKKLVKDIEC